MPFQNWHTLLVFLLNSKYHGSAFLSKRKYMNSLLITHLLLLLIVVISWGGGGVFAFTIFKKNIHVP